MVHTSTNVETKPTLKRADLVIIQFALSYFRKEISELVEMNPKDTLDKINELITIDRTKTTLYKEDDKWCLGICKDYKFDEDATQLGDDEWLKYYLFDTKKEAEIELILASRIEELTLEDIAKVLDIDDRKCLCIGGLNYYYGDGMIGAFVPQTNDMRYSWVNGQDFIGCHGLESTSDLREYMR